jgi:hypothetical protein
MAKRRVTKDLILGRRELERLIEEATVDAHNEDEQVTGFFTMIEDSLALPFVTSVLGVEVSVVAVDLDDDNCLIAVCERGGRRQRVDLAELPIPSPPPSGAEWIAAYRHWVRNR